MSSGVGRPGLLEGMEPSGSVGWGNGPEVEGTTSGGATPGTTSVREPGSAAGGAEPPSFSVRGGPTSIHANLADLDRGAAVLAQATDDAAALSLRAAGWGSLLTLATHHTPTAAILATRTAELSAGLAAISAEAIVLEAGVSSSAGAYRTAEDTAQRVMANILTVPALALFAHQALRDRPAPQAITDVAVQGAPDVLAWSLSLMSPVLAAGFRFSSDVTGRLARDPGKTGPLSGPERLWPLTAAGGIMAGLVQIGPVKIKGTVTDADQWDESWTPPGHGTITDLMDHLDLARGAEEPGSIQLTRVTPEDPGAPEEVWLVGLPGTQAGDYRDDSGWSTNPFDVGGNGEAMALDSQHVARAIDEALQSAGADRGDAVVLTGYSQGGIHAARTAADPRISGTYDVQGLLTIGSPTAEIDLPDGVDAVHLEHSEDPAPGMDGAANPQTGHRTTLTFSGYDEQLYPEGKGIGAGHHFENYRFHAERAEVSPEAQRSAPVLGHLGALTTGSAVTKTVTFERTRPGQPRNPISAGLGHQLKKSPERSAEDRLPAQSPAEHERGLMTPSSSPVPSPAPSPLRPLPPHGLPQSPLPPPLQQHLLR
ncbi:hypothetical protein [Citricoccus sp. GCM10030269]|uniref:hypothetical protein n=1 Tax=Citricoccus sp. GCM10030269 TaxID=3273388 RepID=UPI0036715A93